MSHAALAVSAVLGSALLSIWGITNLIPEDYGTMALEFLAIDVIPMMTIGVFGIVRSNK